MKTVRNLLALLFFMSALAATAQYDPAKVCRVEEGRMIFTLDKNWSKTQMQEIIRQFNLDTMVVKKVWSGLSEIKSGKQTWTITKVDAHHVELSRPFGTGAKSSRTGNVIIVDDRFINASGINERVASPYGVNRFTAFSVFSYRKGSATFYLPKHTKAERVYLSGTFNNWATTQTPMEKTDSGWVVSVKLQPGKYLYKYILDGQWTEDPFNRQMEDDQNGGNNSVVYCYNYRFFVPGYPDAKQVVVAGSFNGWNEKELAMFRVSGGWAINLFLREGTHAYKYIVDGNWVIDKTNKVLRPDGSGHSNSFLSIGDTFHFRLAGNKLASKCAVAGDFNAWNSDELYMQRTASGWDMPYVLPAGNYEYKFILDGEWMKDPVNPFVAFSGGQENSLKAVKPNHLFKLEGSADAKKVVVTGTFTNWSTDNYRMVRKGNEWSLPIYLKPGKYLYKFVIDGKWTEDPANDKWEVNDVGTKNSVLWIGPENK